MERDHCCDYDICILPAGTLKLLESRDRRQIHVSRGALGKFALRVYGAVSGERQIRSASSAEKAA